MTTWNDVQPQSVTAALGRVSYTAYLRRAYLPLRRSQQAPDGLPEIVARAAILPLYRAVLLAHIGYTEMGLEPGAGRWTDQVETYRPQMERDVRRIWRRLAIRGVGRCPFTSDFIAAAWTNGIRKSGARHFHWGQRDCLFSDIEGVAWNAAERVRFAHERRIWRAVHRYFQEYAEAHPEAPREGSRHYRSDLREELLRHMDRCWREVPPVYTGPWPFPYTGDYLVEAIRQLRKGNARRVRSQADAMRYDAFFDPHPERPEHG